MTKQDIIKEGIAQRLHTIVRDIVRIIYEKSSLNCTWGNLPEYWRERYRSDAKNIMQYEDSQGVVLKVDREVQRPVHSQLLSDEFYSEDLKRGFDCGVLEAVHEFLKAGYGAFESLI